MTLNCSRFFAVLLAVSVGGASLAVPSTVWAEPSAADVASAKAALKEGRELRDKGDLPGALARFKAAYALVPTPLTGLDLGKTHMQLGQLLEAREVFVAIGKMPVGAGEKEAHKKARAEADELTPKLAARIPSLTFKLAPTTRTAGLRVAVDDNDIPVDALPIPRKLNPGRHVIRASAPGAAPISDEVVLAEGEAREYPLALMTTTTQPTPYAQGEGTNAAVPSPSSAPSQQTSDRATDAGESDSPKWGLRNTGLVVAGVGVVGMAVGGVLGILAKGRWNDSDAHCAGSKCDKEGTSIRDDARSRASTATIVFGIGAALAAGGAVLIFLPQFLGQKSKSTSASSVHIAVGAGTLFFGGAF